MIRRSHGSTRPDPHLPDTTRVRSGVERHHARSPRLCGHAGHARGPRAARVLPELRAAHRIHHQVDAVDVAGFDHAVAPPGVEDPAFAGAHVVVGIRSEKTTSELQSLIRISYASCCLKKKKKEQR